MAQRKSMAVVPLDVMDSPMLCSSPLRRKSMIAQKACSTPLDQNDDEAEILARRREQELQRSLISTPANSSERRRSIGLVGQLTGAQMAEQYQTCIKLCTENKINVKNAFSLHIIDFMSHMMKKRDENMNNLQVASTTLDVSTKIYGFRVDCIHTDVLKMIGGLGKQGKKGDKDNDDEVPQEGGDGTNEVQEKVKKKRKTQKILCAKESVCGNVEIAIPSSNYERDCDSQTTDTMVQVTLPQHASSGICLHLFNDVIIDLCKGQEQDKEPVQVSQPIIQDFDNVDFCAPFENLELQGWTAEDEPEEEEPPEPTNENLHFDLDASIPDNDDHGNSIMNYFDLEEAVENVDRCAGRPEQIANLVDFREAVVNPSIAEPLEYSYLQKSIRLHWAGPMHWKLKTVPKTLGGSRVIGACRQEAVRRRKEILLEFDEDTEEAVVQSFKSSQAVKLQAKTTRQNWTEEAITLPEDVHYNIENLPRTYFHPGIVVIKKAKDRFNATQLADDVANYNYDNENDRTNFCPNVETTDYPVGEDDGCQDGGGFDEDDEPFTQFTQAFTGDNLVAAPKQTSKIFIPYSQRAKKIDMRQLKSSIWKSLAQSTNDKENMDVTESGEKDTNGEKIVGCKNFSTVYKELPTLLTKANSDALSFPIALVSLLHLANEKSLLIESTSDMSDLAVSQG